MNNIPKISIVTPTFNQGQFIEQTINSVLDQGYPNLEYLILDGGSTDNTVEIIKKYEKHLAYWVSEKDRGQSHAINKGLERCSGQIFNWINSDDYYEGKVFDKVASAFENDEVKMFCGCSHIFGGDKEWVSEGTRLPSVVSNDWIQPVIDQPATFFRMDVVRQFNGLNENLHYTMDLDWLIKYWISYGVTGIKRTSDVLVHFREHPGSKTVNFQAKFNEERLKLYEALINCMEKRVKHDSLKLNYAKINIDFPLIYTTINKFVYYEVLESYAARNRNRFNYLSKLIREKYLPENDLNELRKMKSRMKLFNLVPRFIQKRGHKSE